MPLGTEVGLGPGDIVLDEDPALPAERGTAALPPRFSAHFALARSPISTAAGHLFLDVVCEPSAANLHHKLLELCARFFLDIWHSPLVALMWTAKYRRENGV